MVQKNLKNGHFQRFLTNSLQKRLRPTPDFTFMGGGDGRKSANVKKMRRKVPAGFSSFKFQNFKMTPDLQGAISGTTVVIEPWEWHNSILTEKNAYDRVVLKQIKSSNLKKWYASTDKYQGCKRQWARPTHWRCHFQVKVHANIISSTVQYCVSLTPVLTYPSPFRPFQPLQLFVGTSASFTYMLTLLAASFVGKAGPCDTTRQLGTLLHLEVCLYACQ